MGSDDLQIERNPDLDSVDWSALLKFIHTSFSYMDGRIDPPSSLHRLTPVTLRQKARTESLFLAHCGNELVGCMFCRDEGAWLYVGKVAVPPKMQGQGIGRALFKSAFRLARSQGMMGLELETRVELVENHRVFAKMGFEKVGESAHAGYDRPTSIKMRAVL